MPNLPNGAFQTLTTVPSNGDVNPYGVAFVPQGFPTGGPLSPGDILVSNFNNSANQQGTGTTIVDIHPNGGESLFFQGPAGPARADHRPGCPPARIRDRRQCPGDVRQPGQSACPSARDRCMILDRNGNVVTTLSDSLFLDGPWDLTINDQGSTAQVFVSNVLNGVVTRIDLHDPQDRRSDVQSMTRIGSGYLTRTDPAALVVGPTGLAYNPKNDTLYVASTGDNEIFAITNASTRTSDAGNGIGGVSGQRAPARAARSGAGAQRQPDHGQRRRRQRRPDQPSELVEFTPGGKFVGAFSIDASRAGPSALP